MPMAFCEDKRYDTFPIRCLLARGCTDRKGPWQARYFLSHRRKASSAAKFVTSGSQKVAYPEIVSKTSAAEIAMKYGSLGKPRLSVNPEIIETVCVWNLWTN